MVEFPEVKNGIVGLAECFNDTIILFEIIRFMEESETNLETVRKILTTSEFCYKLIAHLDFGYATEFMAFFFKSFLFPVMNTKSFLKVDKHRHRVTFLNDFPDLIFVEPTFGIKKRTSVTISSNNSDCICDVWKIQLLASKVALSINTTFGLTAWPWARLEMAKNHWCRHAYLGADFESCRLCASGAFYQNLHADAMINWGGTEYGDGKDHVLGMEVLMGSGGNGEIRACFFQVDGKPQKYHFVNIPEEVKFAIYRYGAGNFQNVEGKAVELLFFRKSRGRVYDWEVGEEKKKKYAIMWSNAKKDGKDYVEESSDESDGDV